MGCVADWCESGTISNWHISAVAWTPECQGGKFRARSRLVAEAEEIYSQTLGGKKPVAEPVAELRARINEIDQSVVAAIVAQPDIRSVVLLSDVSKRLPSSIRVHFERFSFDRKKVRINGTTGTYNDVDSIKKSLERSPFYTAVSIDSAGTAGDGSGVTFAISLIL